MTLTRYIAGLSVVLLVWHNFCPAQVNDIPIYVGKEVCLECHSSGDPRRSCLIEPIAGHESSYESLAAPEAPDIAWLSGVGQRPRRSRICLSCHATASDAGPRWTADSFDISHGVQCEACHGAGSLHIVEARRHETEGDRGGSTKEARKGRRSTGATIRSGDHAMCVSCHRDRPSHRSVLDLGARMQAADQLYKTPVNLAVSPDGTALYVVCEQSNSLMIVDTESRKVVYEITVGRQPHDVAVRPDGRALYVTNRASDRLSVIDPESRKVVSEVPVGDEPHGVLTDATGERIYVLNTAEDSISVIDAVELTEIKRLAAGRGPWSLALRPDGRTILVTSVLPNLAQFQAPHVSEVTVVDAQRGVVIGRPSVPDANMLQGIAFIPDSDVAIFTLMRTKNLVPITRLAQGWTITNGLGLLWPDGRLDQILLDEPNAYFPDPNDVAISPDGRYALVTSGGSDRVAVVDLPALLALVSATSDGQRSDVLPNHLGMSRRFVARHISVGASPRGVVISPDGRFAYVANALDDSVTVIDTSDFTLAGLIDLGGPKEITIARRGARLFHNADITFGRQFSCRSCHPDGHVNGLTFDIEADGIGLHPVDNRTLRGILDTAPFKWEGTNPSLRRQCGARLAVFFSRLAPYTSEELDALTRYICTIPRPPNRYRAPGGLTVAQRRGKMIFERRFTNSAAPIPRANRCVTCHHGGYANSPTPTVVGTTMWLDAPVDIEIRDLHDTESFGNLGNYYFHDTGTATKAFDVPHLNNIYDSAPYLHNGSAATLEQIWTRFNFWDEHGVTGDLTRRQFNDLIAYLKAL